MSTSNECTNFRPHSLRPDKCRNCFGDRSRHETPEADKPLTTRQQQLKALPGLTIGKQQQQDQVATSERSTSPLQLMKQASVDESNSDSGGSKQLVDELQKCRQDRDQMSKLIEGYKREIADLQSKQADGCDKNETSSSNSNEANHKATIEKLRLELDESKRKAEVAEREKQQVREELLNLEREMEEMHDNFKEEESEQFEQLKQELDLATKNCKILQIRLSKAERQYNQLEQVKSMLERQLDDWSNRQSRQLQLQQSATDSGNQQQQYKQADSSITSTTGAQLSVSGSFVQLGADYVKLPTSEYDQLLRDLNDTIEREKDLQEQIKYSQEEAQMKGDRLQAVEAENEVLLSKVNKLTLANSRLRSRSMERSDSGSGTGNKVQAATGTNKETEDQTCDFIQQNEQLKLALDLAQSEAERLSNKWQEAMSLAEAREAALKERELRIKKLEEQLDQRPASGALTGSDMSGGNQRETVAKLELECRQLRTRLVRNERECKQLKAELLANGAGSGGAGSILRHQSSLDSSQVTGSEQVKLREIVRQLREECGSLVAQNKDLERKVERLSGQQAASANGSMMESDLLDKLKRQLEASESELARTKSRLVELDCENSRLQRQHRRLVESLEGGAQGAGQSTVISTIISDGSGSLRKTRLPPEHLRDSMTRQELRLALKELESEANELEAKLRARACLAEERKSQQDGAEPAQNTEEQVKSLRRLLEQERLLSNNLKLDVGTLEQVKSELELSVQMLERERVSMDEEVDKLRQVNRDSELELEELRRQQRTLSQRLKDSQVTCEKLRSDLAQLKASAGSGSTSSDPVAEAQSAGDQSPGGSSRTDLMLLTRDLSELKVKNGFLMRQLDIAREDTGRQLEDLRQMHEAQQRRAVELAQIELKERHLSEGQQLRDELNELKQRLAASQRQVTRQEEEASGDRDRLRSMERDWRRDKSQWQQKIEHLEAQLSIERRSNEYKTKEWESMVREKERDLIGVQDKYVQLERDFKRLQNKFTLLEESSDSKEKALVRELEAKKREFSELMATGQLREEEFYEQCKRFNGERATLTETLDSLKRSYDEKLLELKSNRELLALRQEQCYKERVAAQEQLEQLGDQLQRMSEHESQSKLLAQQLQLNERQCEGLKRELGQLKEERARLRTRCEELERRCHRYEKQELITKTSTISTSAAPVASGSGSSSFLKNPFHHKSAEASNKQQAAANRKSAGDQASNASGWLPPETDQGFDTQQQQSSMVEKLSSKINDQRHLINLLKQQNEELQMEVKQLRLLQSTDRIKWQARINQLTSQLNLAEEKLVFEASLLSRCGPDVVEQARRRLEQKWADERQMSLDTMQQQQAQIEMLSRDLRKMGQAHDLLRLQSKQLESHNGKLSRRLIEYQQQPLISHQVIAPPAANDQSAELKACLSRQQRLAATNKRLVGLMRDETKPLVETVTKIIASLDLNTSSAGDQKSPSSSTELPDPIATATLTGSGQRPASTRRPLMTSADLSAAQPAAGNKQAAAAADSSTNKSPSRLARFLGQKSQPKEQLDNRQPEVGNKTELQQSSLDTSGAKTGGPKTVKRVRLKSSALGISVAEKKQLKSHLQQLTLALNELTTGSDFRDSDYDQRKLAPDFASRDMGRAGSSPVEDRPSVQLVDRSVRGSSQQPAADSKQQTTSFVAGGSHNRPHSYSQQLIAEDLSDAPSSAPSQRAVRWKLQPSCPALSSPMDSMSSVDCGQSSQQQQAGDRYRRFPQTSPASYSVATGASLTDYESESSLASYDDLSSAGRFGGPIGGRRFASGAESDSCLGASGAGSGSASGAAGKAAGSGSSSSGKKRGLKTRLTSTLRNISRSITALASDSETESLDGAQSWRQRMRRQPAPATKKRYEREEEDDDNHADDDDESNSNNHNLNARNNNGNDNNDNGFGMREIRV